mmetsp:Transcript_3094/g.10259  ORF Transcript_3094/g.10259 Transcript_3094/m.10259 type:complete len:235 (-) Transcript_3094:6239-6943(-)
MRRRVPLRVGARILVRATPLVPARSELVRRQRARPGGEGARQHDALLAVPRPVPFQNLRVRAHVPGRELRRLVRLGVQPPERLQVFEVIVLRQRLRHVHPGVVPPLRRHHDASNFLHLRVIRRRHAVHVPRDLRPEIRDGDKLLQHVFRQHVRVPALFDVVAVDVDVIHAQVQVRRADRAHAPVRLRTERRLLVRRRRRHDELVAVDVGRLGRHRRHPRGVAAGFFNLRDLLPL